MHRSVHSIPRAGWDACFPGDPEGWSYYCALEQSRLSSFSWVYFVARAGDRVMAAVPAFITDYRLDTIIQGRWKVVLRALPRRLARLLTLRLLCLGSPLADKCHFGFSPDLPAERRTDIAEKLLAGVDAFAAKHGIGLIAAKDVADDDLDPGMVAAFSSAGFSRQRSLPSAILPLGDKDEDAYLKTLSHAARRDVRRKLRFGDAVKIELRRGHEALGLVPDVFHLYESQRGRSAIHFDQFEVLTPEYFHNVLAELGDAAMMFLYFHKDRLIAFNLCYHTDRVFIDKFIGFRKPMARALNLYVLSWMNNVRYCLAHGIPFLQTGQTAYGMKLHLGSELRRTWIFFRHRNPLLNAALRLARPLLAAERYDSDLKHRSGTAG